MKLVRAGFGDHLDNAAPIPAILGVEGLGENIDLRKFVQTQKQPGAPAGEKPKAESFASMPSMRTFV